VRRVRNIRAALIAAADMSGVVGPGWRVHQLKGDRARTWSISVSGNWRLTFDYPAGCNLQPRFGGLPLMSRAPARVGMAPPHPGAVIRDEILDELGLTMSEGRRRWTCAAPPSQT
jgi:proteic killer suppression protein